MLQFDDSDNRTLVTRIAAGDRRALELLYDRFRVPLFAFCCTRTSDRELAEELTQDTLIAVWRSAGDFAGRSGVRSWLIGIARRQAHNTLRRAQLPLADGKVLDMLPATSPGPEEIALGQIGCTEVAQAIATLSAGHQEILSLTFVNELSYVELADVLGVPIGTVKSRLSLARRALRAALNEREVAS